MLVDRKSPEIMRALITAPLFKKQCIVRVRLATDGEEVITILKNGYEETKNTAVGGDYIVTNTSGERYIISDKEFFSRYEATKENGVFAAKGYCRAIPNPFSQSIEIMASRGYPQTGDENCMIADTCDQEGKADGEPYLIDSNAFQQTYKQVIKLLLVQFVLK